MTVFQGVVHIQIRLPSNLPYNKSKNIKFCSKICLETLYTKGAFSSFFTFRSHKFIPPFPSQHISEFAQPFHMYPLTSSEKRLSQKMHAASPSPEEAATSHCQCCRYGISFLDHPVLQIDGLSRRLSVSLQKKQIDQNRYFTRSWGHLLSMDATYCTEEMGKGKIKFHIPWTVLGSLKVNFLMRTIPTTSRGSRTKATFSPLFSYFFLFRSLHFHVRAQPATPTFSK